MSAWRVIILRFFSLLVGADDVKIEFDASMVVKPPLPHSFDGFDISFCHTGEAKKNNNNNNRVA